MQSRLKAEFDRYFFIEPAASIVGGLLSSFISLGTQNRNIVSEIVKDRVYLSNLPRYVPFGDTEQSKLPDQADAALVVSCLDIPELAESALLTEPNGNKIKYHVLAMQDITAVVGSIDQICDTIKLMSAFADQKKPIQIHCYSGVGRSAMMTAIHISYRYLQGDEAVIACIDEQTKLDRASENFIKDLYAAVSKYVYSKRDCCQFDSAKRNETAVSVLTELKAQSQSMSERRDESYQFLAAFVQSPAFKMLNHYFYNSLARPSIYSSYMKAQSTEASQTQQTPLDSRAILKQFFNAFLENQNGWYQDLIAAVNKVKSETANPLLQFCNDAPSASSASAEEKQSAVSNERRELLNGIMITLNQLAKQYPHALHSEQFILHQALMASMEKTSHIKLTS